MPRKLVSVVALIDTKGDFTPRSIIWHDGREFPIYAVTSRSRTVEPVTKEQGWRFGVTLERPIGYFGRWLYKFGRFWYVYPQDGSKWVPQP